MGTSRKRALVVLDRLRAEHFLSQPAGFGALPFSRYPRALHVLARTKQLPVSASWQHACSFLEQASPRVHRACCSSWYARATDTRNLAATRRNGKGNASGVEKKRVNITVR